MNCIRTALILTASLAFAVSLSAQQSPSPSADSSDATTIRGCLEGERGNYILVEKTGSVYVLKGVGNKLDSHLNREVEVKGEMLPGTIKTGVRPEKSGSNPSDTIHGVDGTPFEVQNPLTDVKTLAKHCKAADAR